MISMIRMLESLVQHSYDGGQAIKDVIRLMNRIDSVRDFYLVSHGVRSDGFAWPIPASLETFMDSDLNSRDDGHPVLDCDFNNLYYLQNWNRFYENYNMFYDNYTWVNGRVVFQFHNEDAVLEVYGVLERRNWLFDYFKAEFINFELSENPKTDKMLAQELIAKFGSIIETIKSC